MMRSTLPSGWAECAVEDIGQLIRGITYKKEQSANRPGPPLVPILRATNINGTLSYDELVYVPRTLVDHEQLLREGDIVFAMSSGSVDLVGKSARASADFEGSCGAFCAILRLHRGASNKFVAHLFQATAFRRQISEAAKGSNINNLKREHILGYRVVLPPQQEQQRIVAKIEELFSELDKGLETLKLARAQLAVYRQALLKHAFEGKLTADWRAEQPTFGERRALESSSDLPSGWSWQRLDGISKVTGGLTKNPKRDDLPTRMKYLRVANVYADRLDLNDVREIGVTEDEAGRLLLLKGDLLVVEGNGSVEQIGRVAEWTASVPGCAHQNHLIRVRLNGAVPPRFALLFLLSPLGRAAIVKAASSTTGLHTLSISKVGSLNIPIAPPREQQALLALLEPALDYVANLEAEIEANLQRSEALRQSILKQAFAGELVPQDPNDEPAATLLTRIRAERAQAAPLVKAKSTRTPRVANA